MLCPECLDGENIGCHGTTYRRSRKAFCLPEEVSQDESRSFSGEKSWFRQYEEEGIVEQWSGLRCWLEQRPTCEQAETLDKGPYGYERGVGGEAKGSSHTAQHLLYHLNGGNFGNNCQQRDNLIPHAL